jgi:hypothetical protein
MQLNISTKCSWTESRQGMNSIGTDSLYLQTLEYSYASLAISLLPGRIMNRPFCEAANLI